ncbi:MAG: heavy metal-responsive transcriptional regulator [Calditrichaeota bacterium]|nr:heavy metal-responsive transcriptional regulator [Calditrichota bacterium]
METFSIGQLAKQAGLNIQTIRYYERRGLLPAPKRRESGYRYYLAEDLSRLEFIKHAKSLGFSLNEINELLALRVDPDHTCDDFREEATQKIAEIDIKIKQLQRIKKALLQLTAACRTKEATVECPILQFLEDTK